MNRWWLAGLFLLFAHGAHAAPSLNCSDGFEVVSVDGQPSCGIALPFTSADAITAASTMPVLLPVYDVTGAQKTPSHLVIGTVALVAGSATVTLTNAAAYTSASTYFCNSTDAGLISQASSLSKTSGAVFVVKGILTATISYMCLGW